MTTLKQEATALFALDQQPTESHCNTVLFRLILAIVLVSLMACKSRQDITAGKQSRAPQEATESEKPNASIQRFSQILEPLIDPEKLDALAGKRAATPRLRKACYWLEIARREGFAPKDVITQAQKLTAPQNKARAQAQLESLVRNRTILERLGCLDESGMDKLRRGRAPTITKGPYKDELATVDHIIPRSVCPELDNRLYNLEFMPDTLNKRKSDKIGDRQRQLARKWNEAGLLSKSGYLRVTR